MLRLASDGTYGRERWFYSTFTSAKLCRCVACRALRLRAGAAACVEQNHTRGRFYASKRSKDNHFLEAFEIAEHLER